MSGFIFRIPRQKKPRPSEILNFLDPSASIDFDLAPEQAIKYFQDKGLKISFNWQDMIGSEHDTAFTIAKMLDKDLLDTVRKRLDQALANGETFQAFADDIIPTLQAKGFWGRQLMTDPLNGALVNAQLGSPWRLETIFRTNMQSAYAVGQWQAIDEFKDEAPFLMYDAVDDDRTRADHKVLDNLVREVDDLFWENYYPPNGWNCRCGVIQLDQAELDELGLIPGKGTPLGFKSEKWTNPRTGKTMSIPRGVDPGFNHNPGKTRLEKLKQLDAEKTAVLPPDLKAAAVRFNAKQEAIEAAQKAKAMKTAQAWQQAESIRAQKKVMADEQIAQTAISMALKNNTPNLAAAIKKVQKTKASETMTAVELLDAATKQAETAAQSKALYKYKQALIEGKVPGKNAQNVFNALPEEAQISIIKEIQDKTGATKAMEELADIASNPDQFKVENKFLQQYINTQGPIQPLKAVQVLDTIKQKTAQEKLAKAQSKLVSKYKMAIINGKNPTEAQTAAWNNLTATKQAEIQEAITAALAKKNADLEAKAAQATVPLDLEDKSLDLANFEKYDSQKGSNQGGFYRDTETGARYYIKLPDTDDHSWNEILAAKLYQLAGVDVPEVNPINMDGRTGVASKLVEGVVKNKEATRTASGSQEGFLVDAWLANWDTVGTGFDNMLIKDGKAWRIDVGGSLLYRAQGGPKGSALVSDDIPEIDSLRDGLINEYSAYTFGNITQQQLEAGALKILGVKPEQIRELVDKYGPGGQAMKDSLFQTLIGRRQVIADRYGYLLEAKPEPAKTGGLATSKIRQAEIYDAKASGHNILADKGDIEDHNIKITRRLDQDGNETLRVDFKMTPEAMARQKVSTTEVGGGPGSFSLNDALTKTVTALRGIGAQANQGDVYRDKDVDRILEAYGAVEDAKKELQQLVDAGKLSSKNNLKAKLLLTELSEAVLEHQKAKVGEPAVSPSKLINANQESIFELVVKDKPAASGFEFVRSDSYYQHQGMRVRDGFLTGNGNLIDINRAERGFHKAEHKGIQVIQHREKSHLFRYGQTHFEVPADKPELIDEIFEQLDIDVTPPSLLDRQELVLIATAKRRYISRTGSSEDWRQFRKLLEEPDQETRVKIMAAQLSADSGVDILKAPEFTRPDLTYANGGRIAMLRPDMNTPEFQVWADNHFLYHAIGTLSKAGPSASSSNSVTTSIVQIIDGGGNLASLLDRIRRGLPESSAAATADYREGGATNVFTRIKSKKGTENKGVKAVGFYWRPHRLMRRTDRITYSGDNFGDMTDSAQSGHLDTPKDFTRIASNSGDETMFKESLSLYQDLEKIQVHSYKNQQEIIKALKRNGITKWPDGRELDEVVRYD